MTNLKPYAIEYRHKGKTWVAEIFATDPHDAQQRLNAIYFNGQPQEIVFSTDDSWLTKLARRVRELFA